jgi:hypothetical protein
VPPLALLREPYGDPGRRKNKDDRYGPCQPAA